MFRRPDHPNPPVFIEIDRKMGVQYNGAVIDGIPAPRKRGAVKIHPLTPRAVSGGPGVPGHSGLGAAIIR